MITQDYLKELLHYDPDTGVFTWKTRSLQRFSDLRSFAAWNARYAGEVAGTDRPNGRNTYRMITIDSSPRRAHRLAWLYIYGEFPKEQIDHIDGDGSNNKIDNLRDVTNKENRKNQRIPSTNTSGFMGVSFSKAKCKWQAVISMAPKQKHLGYFASIDDALEARKSAEIEYGYHKNHGRT